MADKCKTPRCKNVPAKGRLCGTCSARAWRASNPVRYAFTALKNNAKRRGIAFELSLEEFEAFCVKTEYLRGKGRTSESFSVDRIDIRHGYRADNLQILPLGENVRKRNLDYCYVSKTARYSPAYEPPRDNGENYF